MIRRTGMTARELQQRASFYRARAAHLTAKARHEQRDDPEHAQYLQGVAANYLRDAEQLAPASTGARADLIAHLRTLGRRKGTARAVA